MNTEEAYIHDAYEIETVNNQVGYISQTTPSDTKTICEVSPPPPFVVPIIFIPGIMGSNLKNKNDDEIWYPPNGLVKGIKEISLWKKKDAAQRQTELDLKSTMVGYDGEIKLNKKLIPYITQEIAKDRGWGSVWSKGYGEILIYLESYLNHNLINNIKNRTDDGFKGTDEWEKIVKIGKIKKKQDHINKNWQPDKFFELLEEMDHKALVNYAFPVFACGYNWLDTNKSSAELVAARMNNEVMQQLKKEFPSSIFKKFIIVTHSMGGLVTRALIQNPSIKDNIVGVVHGVMPASGAPAVYQRLTMGWDGFKATDGGLFDKIGAWVAAPMFGKDSKDLTAVLASAPGALELLPFANFRNNIEIPNSPKAWLILKAIKTKSQSNNGTITAYLPQTDDPYTEIYKKKDVWWQMVNEDYIDPSGQITEKLDSKNGKTVFDEYTKVIDVVLELHNLIKDHYHENTYAHYAQDGDHKAFGQVTWTCHDKLNISTEDELINLVEKYGVNQKIPATDDASEGANSAETQSRFVIVQNDENEQDGVREVIFDEQYQISKNNKATFKVEIHPTSPGDGTVCYQSGADTRAEGRNLKQTFVINGYDHASNYAHKDSQRCTLYCIAKIALDIN